MSARASIGDSPDYGVVWTSNDAELGDEFEDFLTERCFVLFHNRFEGDKVSLLFGQASSVDKVGELYERFLREKSAK
jgi:hypothetical protein